MSFTPYLNDVNINIQNIQTNNPIDNINDLTKFVNDDTNKATQADIEILFKSNELNKYKNQ